MAAASPGEAPETEKYSGLKLTGRKVTAKKWDELMAGKKFATFNSLPTVTTESSSIVAVGVLYERGIQKTSATGGRFVHWSLTDLSFPQPRLLKLLLLGEAYETWDLDLGKTVKYGAVFGILNPTPSQPSTARKDEDTLVSAKITHSTQLVHLGNCPSLGFCSCRKRDGLPCSMPCDVDRGGGALVCFYHTMQKEADKVRKWSKKPTGKEGGSTSGLIVMEGKAPRPAPVRRPAGGIAKDPAVERLLSGRLPATPVRKLAKDLPAAAGVKPARQSQSPADRLQSPGLAPRPQAAFPKDSARPAPSGSPRPASCPEQGASYLERQILALFPEGLPAPDPNRPMQSRIEFEKASQEALRTHEGRLASSQPPPMPQRTAQLGGGAPPLSTCGVTVQPEPKEMNRLLAAKPASTASMRQLESDFGRKAARQLAFKADPRLDVVRQQTSRFQSAMEEERAAKRMRRLHELEAMDAAQEKMEEIKSMKVRAWKCANCFLTFESSEQLKSCQEKGHKVVEKEATKTRWECSGCRHSEAVLDRQLPSYCRSCNCQNFKQVSLRKMQRSAPMERDLLLPRGEELPFLNSIHIPDMQSKALFREARDDYEGL